MKPAEDEVKANAVVDEAGWLRCRK